MSTAASAAPSAQHPHPNPWRVAIIAGMASFLDAASIVATGSALVLFEDRLGLDGGQIGALSALLTISIAIGAFFGGRLGDRFGRRRVFTVTMIAYVAGAILATTAWDIVPLYIGLALLGLGGGADLPVSMAMIAESAPAGRRGRMVTFSHILWMGGIVAISVIGIFVGGMGETGARILYGFLVVVAAIVLVLRSRLPESEVWQRANDTRTAQLAVVAAGGSRADDIGALKNLLRSRYLAVVIGLGLFYAIINIALNTNGQFSSFLFVETAGSTVSTASAVTLASFVVSLAGNLLLMRLADTRYRMLGFVLGSVLMVAAFIVPALVGASVLTLVAMTALLSAGGAIAGEPMFKIWAQELFPTLYRSTAQGFMIAFTRVVAAVVALFTPALVDIGAGALFWFLVVTTAVASLIGILWIARIPRAPDDEADAAATTSDATAASDAAALKRAGATIPGATSVAP